MKKEEIEKRIEELRNEQRRLEVEFSFLNGKITGRIDILNELLLEPKEEE